jgi:hypothetical protein
MAGPKALSFRSSTSGPPAKFVSIVSVSSTSRLPRASGLILQHAWQPLSYGRRIAILPGQAPAEEFSTLVHELAHLCCVRSYVA